MNGNDTKTVVLIEIDTLTKAAEDVNETKGNIVRLANDISAINHASKSGKASPVLDVDTAVDSIKAEADKLSDYMATMHKSTMNIKNILGPVLTWCNVGVVDPKVGISLPNWEPNTYYAEMSRIVPRELDKKDGTDRVKDSNPVMHCYQVAEAGRSGSVPPVFTPYLGDKTMDSDYHNNPEYAKVRIQQAEAPVGQPETQAVKKPVQVKADEHKPSLMDRIVTDVKEVTDKVRGNDEDKDMKKAEKAKDKE